jgi:hypothetical protein
VLIAQFSDRSLNPNTIHFFFHHGSAFVFFKRPTLVSPPA